MARSAAGEARWASLGEGPRALARVVGAQEDALREELHPEERVLIDVAAEFDEPFREPDRERRVRRDLLGEPRRRRDVLARRDDLVHEADRERLVGADHPTRQDELLRLRIPDGADEARRTA